MSALRGNQRRDPKTGQMMPGYRAVDEPEYKIWEGIVQRCCNPNNNRYADYGGRGIRLFPAWRLSYALFIKDVGRRFKGATIERIDNNQGYVPGNVRWATRREQQRNMRSNRWLEFGDEIRTVTEWANHLGVRPQTITTRLSRGWSVERTLTHGAEGRRPVRVSQ